MGLQLVCAIPWARLKPIMTNKTEKREQSGKQGIASTLGGSAIQELRQPVEYHAQRKCKDRWGISMNIKRSLHIRSQWHWGPPPPTHCRGIPL